MNTPQTYKKVQEKVLQYQQRAFHILSECGIDQPQSLIIDLEKESKETSASSDIS